MRYVRFKVSNYKSFRHAKEIHLSAGLNVIVGQNNAGKTALLEALSLSYSERPHRSEATLPQRDTPIPQNASIEFAIAVDVDEALALLERSPRSFISVPGREPFQMEANKIAALVNRTFTVRCVFELHHGVSEAFLDEYPAQSNSQHAAHCHSAGTEIRIDTVTAFSVSAGERLPLLLARAFRSRIYAFKAERMNIGQCPIADDPELQPNAANLASVLHLLQSNPSRYKRFESFVKSVFPQIRQITAQPTSGNTRILIWTVEPDTERDDLAFPLAECGTGIGQVLAMLYVVLTSHESRVLLIDEPQSFLHPGAIRKLFEIFAAHPQHQYVVTTHSPVALTSFPPSTLTLLSMNGPETNSRQIDQAEATDLRSVLAEVGARLSDVFGADGVLWVEGATEETCFPLIRKRALGKNEVASGTVILGVRQTGDFGRRTARSTLEIYSRLTRGPALLPPAVGFIFDSEKLSDQEKRDLVRESKNGIRFLPRRVFENYLLHPDAIVNLVNAIEGFRSQAVTRDDIVQWIREHGRNAKYLPSAKRRSSELTDEAWLKCVDGASLLDDLFGELSEQRVSYRKVAHGAALTEWLCRHDFDALAEVSETIRSAMAESQS